MCDGSEPNLHAFVNAKCHHLLDLGDNPSDIPTDIPDSAKCFSSGDLKPCTSRYSSSDGLLRVWLDPNTLPQALGSSLSKVRYCNISTAARVIYERLAWDVESRVSMTSSRTRSTWTLAKIRVTS
jgi:hypothetical protein